MKIFVHWHPYCTLLTTNWTATSKVILKISFKSYPFESILIYLNFLDVTKWIKILEEKKDSISIALSSTEKKEKILTKPDIITV